MFFSDPDHLMQLLSYAASNERTVLEFRSTGEGAETEVKVLDITDHVETLEEMIDLDDEFETPELPDEDHVSPDRAANESE